MVYMGAEGGGRGGKGENVNSTGYIPCSMHDGGVGGGCQSFNINQTL